MKKLLHILILFSFSHSAYSQINLVPNNSFEQYDTCPSGQGQVLKAVDWNSFGYSPDYFHICSSLSYSVPQNAYGFQFAATGDAYAGIFTFSPQFPNVREYIGGKLLAPLVPGQKYNVSFKTVFADNPFVDCPHNNIGILFSTISYSVDSFCPPPCNTTLFTPKNFAHILDTNIISDTVNWTTIVGNIIADSAYQYIIIGNFFDDANTTYTDLNSGNGGCQANYIIDDIIVAPDSLMGIENSETEFLFTISPNPTIGILNISYMSKSDFSILLFDALGRRLFFLSNQNSNCTLDLTTLQAGVYHLRIFSNKLIIHKKIIHLK